MAVLLLLALKGVDKVKAYEQPEKGLAARIPPAGMDWRRCHGCGHGYYIMSNGMHPTTECPRLCQHVQERGTSAARLTEQGLAALARELGQPL